MHAIELEGVETTVHKTHEWVKDIMSAMGADDAHLAYRALRAVLHALRDRLTVDEAVQLGAQLPMLIRGLYYEGWSPRGKPVKAHREQFLASIRAAEGTRPGQMHPEVLARAVLTVLSRRISAGEVRDIKASIPTELRDLWPEPSPPANR